MPSDTSASHRHAAVPLQPTATPEARQLVNDVHSRLNPTHVRRILTIRDEDDITGAIRDAAASGESICVGGGRHAMGAQQFATDGVLLDTRSFRGVRAFDAARGLIEVEAGIQWPDLVDALASLQAGESSPWGIRQKQTGADRLSIGGAVSANVHGRGLAMRPFIADVEALTIVDPAGRLIECSRSRDAERFRLVVGGYGLMGVVATVTLRLARRHQVERIVEIETADHLARRFEERIADGFTFGDFQFAVDARSADFLHRGVFSCYRPLTTLNPIPAEQRALSDADWAALLHLAHTDKSRAFELYSAHYLATNGQRYWSDTHQLTTYIDDYHAAIDRSRGTCPGSEMITELYVPRPALAAFLAAAAADFRRHDVDCIYGTVRLIDRDDESVLAWAREPWACTVFNLHIDHTPRGLEHAAAAFRRLIDIAIALGGSYYLTYHRWATRDQLVRCHPRIEEFLRRKRALHPDERLQSDWYRHYRTLFAEY